MNEPIPPDALDDRLGFIGTSGSGKTYAAGTAVERLLATGARCVIVDPLDVWWGLRLLADGKTPSPYSVVIFGGAHGDLPLNEHAGALLGETVAGMAESCIVSLGGLQTKSAERRFMLAFLDAIYRKADPATHGPFHIVFDEADLWAPQKSSEPMLQSRMEEIVRRGRIKGFIPWLITQRPAVLSKDVLSQVDGLIALKLTASQDRDAIGGWIEGAADRATGRDILASLPTMQQGEGVVWLPGRGVLNRTTFPAKLTFDSSRSPKRGETRKATTLKPLDLPALRGRMAAVEAEVAANDPKTLKAEIARLTKALAAAPQAGVDADALRHAVDAAFLQGVAEGERRGNVSGQALMLTRVRSALDGLRVEPASDDAATPRAAPRPVPAPRQSPPTPAPEPRQSEGNPAVTGPQRRVLDALAWWKAFGITQPASEQVAFIAGYSASSSGYANLKGAMRSAGLIEYPRPGRICLTSAGSEAAEAPNVPLTIEAFHEAVRAKLSGPQWRMLHPLIQVYPEALSSAQLAERADYSVTSSGFANLRGQMRSLGLLDYPTSGQVRAADWLFP